MSDKAQQKARDVSKRWLKEVNPTSVLKEFVQRVNPVVSGWMDYYGKFYASELRSTMIYTVGQ